MPPDVRLQPCHSPFSKELSNHYYLNLKAGVETVVERKVTVVVDKTGSESISSLKNKAFDLMKKRKNETFADLLASNTAYFSTVWEKSDIEIEGNDMDQQGIRYCLFQLEQNYHGYAEDNNIGAKGLTGEAYSGHAFWDSETYCLPYYLFSNQKAALNLLLFRYHTLEEAKARAADLDCVGACYPIATRNGKEACTLWQHASCQLQPTSGVCH